MSSSHTRLLAILPELSEWNEGKGMAPEGWLGAYGSVPSALMYSSLFWPEFVEFEGCLLWHDATPDLFFQWMTTLGGNCTAVEGVMNHVHITDVFLNAPEVPTDEQVDYLGHLLKDMWSLKLRRDFPHLDVQVDFRWDDPEASDTAQLTVYCLRKDPLADTP